MRLEVAFGTPNSAWIRFYFLVFLGKLLYLKNVSCVVILKGIQTRVLQTMKNGEFAFQWFCDAIEFWCA